MPRKFKVGDRVPRIVMNVSWHGVRYLVPCMTREERANRLPVEAAPAKPRKRGK